MLLPIGARHVSAPRSSVPDAEPPAGHGELILVVEDDPAVRSLLGRTLEQHGYRVLAADSGASALNAWREHAAEIALLLSDVVIPGDLTLAEPGAQP